MNASDVSTPQEALREMVAAGAVFTVQLRTDTLGYSFTYRVVEGGDAQRCRELLAAVKARPPIFYQAFRAAVQDGTRPGVDVGVVETTPTSLAREGGAETPSFDSAPAAPSSKGVETPLIVENVQTSSTRPGDLLSPEGGVSPSPLLRTSIKRGAA